MRSSPLAAGVFSFSLLGFATAAHACGAHYPPDRYSTLPGATILRPDMLVVLPILAGALERPIYTLAGYRDRTLAFSIQANFIAYLASTVTGCASIAATMTASALMPLMVLPVFAAVLVKLWWFDRVPRESDAAVHRFGWFLLATLFSHTVIGLMPYWMYILGTDRQNYAWSIRTYQGPAILATAVLAVVTLVYLFRTVRRPERGEDPRRGFEVLPANPQPLPVALSGA